MQRPVISFFVTHCTTIRSIGAISVSAIEREFQLRLARWRTSTGDTCGLDIRSGVTLIWVG
jgi:hypothetical protein